MAGNGDGRGLALNHIPRPEVFCAVSYAFEKRIHHEPGGEEDHNADDSIGQYGLTLFSLLGVPSSHSGYHHEKPSIPEHESGYGGCEVGDGLIHQVLGKGDQIADGAVGLIGVLRTEELAAALDEAGVGGGVGGKGECEGE